MALAPAGREYATSRLPAFRSGGRIAALVVAALSLIALSLLGTGYHLGGVGTHTWLCLLAASAAILLLAPGNAGEPSRLRGLGWIAAALTLLLALANGPQRHLPGLMPESPAWTIAFSVLALSLLFKWRLPRVAITLDMTAGFLGYLVVLMFAFKLPVNTRQSAPLHFLAGLAIFALCGAWMAVYPEIRPVGYFVERGSAAVALRRVLPITLLFPPLLVVLSVMQRISNGKLSQVSNWALILSAVGFGAALLWLIAHSLDRMDQIRNAADSQLRESETQLRTVMDSTTEGMYAVDLDGRCIWCNPAALRLLGLADASQLLGQQVHEAIHHTRPDGTPYPASECAMLLATRANQNFTADDELLWRPDGTSFPADCRSSPLRRDGRLAGAVVTFADVTQRRSLQAQFHQAQKMEAVGRLAAGIAHDFNNLLTVINGYTDMLLRKPLEPSLKTKIGNIRTAGERAAGLTQQLLAFSRQQVMQPKVLDLNAVLAEMDPLLRRLLGEDLVLVTELAPKLAPVRADPGQIGQVLMNLAVNARDAMPEGGRLTIETGNVELDEFYSSTHPEVVPGQYVMLAVTDSGCGMDAATLSKAFEPFFTTKGKGKGTGLGLATVFGIVKQSGGNVAIYSEVGHGTSVKVYLPSLAASAHVDGYAPAKMEEAAGHETLLVVEDEDNVRELMEEILRDSGYTILACSQPEQAIVLCRQHTGRIHLLISDVVMPGMDGRKLAAQLVKQRPDMSVLFISGYPDKAISHNGNLEAGLSFIQKPFTPDALIRKVRSVLDANPNAAALSPAGKHD